MLVVCPQCDSRYQLPDAKIKPQGTKVRCPNCQHKFVVKRTDPDLSEEKTLTKKSEVTKQSPPPSPPPPEPTAASEEEVTKDTRESSVPPDLSSRETAPPEERMDSTEERAFDGATRVSKKVREPSPFRPPTPAEKMEDPRVESFDEPVAPPQPIAEEDSKPFGDATFLAIQQMSKKKKNYGKRAMGFAVVAALAAGVYLAWPYLSNLEFGKPVRSGASSAQIQVVHPENWYRDDPRIFQSVLTQMAALPAADRDQNENRALRAEALILNGLYTGQADQIAKGVAIASSLIPRFPNSSAGFLGMSSFHLFNDDPDNLRLLVESWPPEMHNDLEYQLAKVVVDADEGAVTPSMNSLKDILKQKNDFQRAYSVGFYLALKSPQAANETLGERWQSQMEQRYRRHRKLLQDQGYTLPPLYQNIDRALAKKDSDFSRQVKAEEAAEKKSPEPVRKRVKRAEPAPEVQEIEKKPPPPNPFERKKTASAPERRSRNRLPRESKNLRDQTQLALRGVTQARRLFNEGQQLQKSNDLDQALLKYREALKQNPDFADVYKQMGIIYRKRDQSDRALRSFKIYLQLQPDSRDKRRVEGWIADLQ